MKQGLLACLWLVSVLLVGWTSFEVCTREARNPEDLAPLASFRGQPVVRRDIENYFPVFRSKVAGELILARLAAEACGDRSDAPGKSEFYLKKLLEREWPDARLRAFFELFKEELTSYELATDRWQKAYSAADLEEEFGAESSEHIKTLSVGTEYKVNPEVRLRLLRKRSRFEDLKPDLEARIFRARRAVLVNQLLARAHIAVLGRLGDNAEVLEFGL